MNTQYPDWMTNAEAAVYCGVSTATMKNSRTSGRLLGRPCPVHKPTGERKIMYSYEVLKAWMNDVDSISISRGICVKGESRFQDEQSAVS